VLLVSRGTFAERGSLSYFCSLLAQTPVLVMKPAVFFHLKTFLVLRVTLTLVFDS
jgi:hypothetical protein